MLYNLVSLDIFGIILLGALVALIAAAYVVHHFGRPNCQLIHYISKAGDPNGRENLAKFLAYRSKGNHHNSPDLWYSFLPAADRLHHEYLRRRRHLL